ncbi:hypothetical protein BDR26DRAFT_880219 [Obelidium mucronatum]|nr:hypothetical protein BDR26DRAFT_880219 [Obelidium mucronatum]
MLYSVLWLIFLAVPTIQHGMMCWPYIRAHPGDPQNGWTLARRRFNDVIGGGKCHGLKPATVLTPPLKPGKTSIDYILTQTHLGNCTVYLDRGKGQEKIGFDATCGMQTPPYRSTINITLPNGNYRGVIRWLYETANGSGELFDSCADVTVSKTGSNARTQDSCNRTAMWWPETCKSGQSRCTFANGVSTGYQVCLGGYFYPKDCVPGTLCATTNGKATCKKRGT